MAQEGVEPSASLVLSESGLPIAHLSRKHSHPCPSTQWGILNPQAPGSEPGAVAFGLPFPITSARKLLTNRSYGVSYHLCSG